MRTTLYILDQGLKGVGGHYFEYVRSIQAAAALEGIDTIIGCHATAAGGKLALGALHPIYSDDVWATLPGETYDSPVNLRGVSERFVAETRNLLTRFPPKPGDTIFMPNIAKPHLMAAALLAEEYASQGVRLCYMFRYPSGFFLGGVAEEAFRRLEAAAASGLIFLCTDSHRLADELSALCPIPFTVVPIPHTDHVSRSRTDERTPPPLHLVSLGNARGEKGIRDIHDAIRLSASKPWANDVRFSIQINEPYEAEDVAAALLKDADPRVTLISDALDSDAYYQLLADADVVLTPYHRNIYRDRTSGVFLEALLAGKLTICTKDTWMHDLLVKHGGGIAVEDRSPEAICRAIGDILQRYAHFSDNAHTAAAYWAPIHSAENLVAHLIGRTGRPVTAAEGKRAVIFFPWGDALGGNSGAARRLRLMVTYLEQHFSEVRVLFAASGEVSGPIGLRSEAEAYHYYNNQSKALRFGLRAASRLLGGKRDESFHLWYHLWPRLDRRFRDKCRDLVKWADEVYCEYSYFAPVLRSICEREGKRLHVTQYDIVSEQAGDVPVVGRATRALEFGSLRQISALYAVSKKDQTALLNEGISAELIPHPIDIDEGRSLTLPEERAAILEKAVGVRDPDHRVCFFVGSNYGPNKAAAERVREIAGQMRSDPQTPGLHFVVAGGCMAPDQDENFVSLGIVERPVLTALYEEADIVLVPLTEGTGTSIKSIEALAKGALIISTSIGMRGLDVISEVHCIVEDDLSLYPKRIRDLLNDPEKSRAIRSAAAQFGAGYDYGTLFAPYAQAAATETASPAVRG